MTTLGERPALPDQVDLVVVGGGISGAVCAAEAAQRGAKVLVVEKEAGLALEASGRSFGSLRLQGRHPAELPLAVDAIERWERAARTLGTDFEFAQGGNVYVGETAAELGLLEAQLESAKAAGFTDVRLLGPAETRELVPALAGDVAGALYSPRDAHCDPGKAVLAYARAAERHGARIALATKATAIQEARGRVSALRTDRGLVRAARVVVAAGVWTPQLVRPLGIHVPIKRIIYTNGETAPLPVFLTATLRGFHFSCRQRPTGELLVGAGLNARVTYEVSLDEWRRARLWGPRFWANRRQIRVRVNPRALGRELRGAFGPPASGIPRDAHPTADEPAMHAAFDVLRARLPPARVGVLRRTWAGWLDLAPDGLPIIEPGVGPEGLVLLTGLSGHGLALAPVLGRILADLALDGRTAYDLAPFRLRRFDGPVPLPPRLV